MIDRLLERPRAVLGTLVGVQIVATVVLALSVDHNGWVWFQGGDQIWQTTQGWLLGHLVLPPTELGYVWSLVLMPVMWITGPTYVEALPPLVVFQVLVLGPVALLCVYDLASRIGGRLLGYWASLLWVVAPFASIPLFVDRYQERFAAEVLPQALGLTAMPDFPSMVPRARFGRLRRPLARGTAADRRRPRRSPPGSCRRAQATEHAARCRRRTRVRRAPSMAGRRRVRRDAAPTLLLLAIWKERGLGTIPAFALEQMHLAAGGAGPTAVSVDLGRYFDLDFEHWRTQMDQLREFFWSARLAQWAPFAGLIAVVRVRRGAIAALLAGWLAAFLVVKGFSPRATIESNTFWRLLMPAWPAYLLLFASIPLLVPTLAPRLGDRLTAPARSPVSRRWVAVVAALTLLVPAVFVVGSSPLDNPDLALTQDDQGNFILTSVDTTHRSPRRGLGWRTHPLVDRRTMARERLLPRVPRRRQRRQVREQRRPPGPVVLPAKHADRDDACAHVRRPGPAARRDLPGRRRNELDRRPGGRRRLRLQPPGGRSRLRRSSSRAMRCARSTFSSVSREITVE